MSAPAAPVRVGVGVAREELELAHDLGDAVHAGGDIVEDGQRALERLIGPQSVRDRPVR